MAVRTPRRADVRANGNRWWRKYLVYRFVDTDGLVGAPKALTSRHFTLRRASRVARKWAEPRVEPRSRVLETHTEW